MKKKVLGKQENTKTIDYWSSVKKVLLVAPVMSRSGYGEMGRFALRSVLSNQH